MDNEGANDQRHESLNCRPRIAKLIAKIALNYFCVCVCAILLHGENSSFDTC